MTYRSRLCAWPLHVNQFVIKKDLWFYTLLGVYKCSSKLHSLSVQCMKCNMNTTLLIDFSNVRSREVVACTSRVICAPRNRAWRCLEPSLHKRGRSTGTPHTSGYSNMSDPVLLWNDNFISSYVKTRTKSQICEGFYIDKRFRLLVLSIVWR